MFCVKDCEITPKQFLSMAWDIDRRIERKIEERERLESKLTAGRITNLSGMPRGGRYDWTDAVSSVLRITDQINREINKLCAVKRLVNDAIDRVEDRRYRTVLELRYRNYHTWEEIALEMQYDERHVHRLHGEALLCVTVPEELREVLRDDLPE